MTLPQARLYEAQRHAAQEEQSKARKGLAGSGDRSDRVRTYNFPQVEPGPQPAPCCVLPSVSACCADSEMHFSPDKTDSRLASCCVVHSAVD